MLARELRRDADRDVFQALKTIQDLNGQLQVSKSNFDAFWGAMKYILSYIGQPGDDVLHSNMGDYVALIPSWFFSFMKDSLRTCVSNVLGHVQVLAPEAPLETIAKANPSEEYLEQVYATEAELGPHVNQVLDLLDLGDDPSAPLS